MLEEKEEELQPSVSCDGNGRLLPTWMLHCDRNPTFFSCLRRRRRVKASLLQPDLGPRLIQHQLKSRLTTTIVATNQRLQASDRHFSEDLLKRLDGLVSQTGEFPTSSLTCSHFHPVPPNSIQFLNYLLVNRAHQNQKEENRPVFITQTSTKQKQNPLKFLWNQWSCCGNCRDALRCSDLLGDWS